MIIRLKSRPRPNAKINRAAAYLLMFLLVIISFSIEIFPQSIGGGYSESYLLRNVGARQIALAGAYAAIANEPIAIYYNPAGLGFLSTDPMVASTFSSLGFGRSHTSLTWAQEVYPNLGAGVGINGLVSGSFTGRDIKGNPIGDFSDFQYSFVAAAAYRIESASMGASVKYMTNNLIGSSTSAHGYGFDVGTKFNVLDMVSVGIAVQNISANMFWNNPNKDMETLPYVVRAGIAMEYGLNDEVYKTRSTVTGEPEDVYIPASRYVLFGLDVLMIQNDVTPSLVLGVEAVPHELIAFRGGIELYGDDMGEPMLFPMTIWGAGVSLRPDIEGIPFSFDIDYSISNEYLTESGIGHHLSLIFVF